MTHEHENTPPPTITQLKHALEDTCLIPGCDPALLARQAELLDQLFAVLLEKKVLDQLNSTYSDTPQSWLKFALRVQKQCISTVKARAAVEYMGHLSAHAPLSTLPHPRRIEKQTE